MRVPPKVEKGWSSSHDVEKKRIHDFNNELTELVFAIQLGDDALSRHYLDQLRDKYRDALIPPCPRKKAA